jgi:AraC-like DNA-binding protein
MQEINTGRTKADSFDVPGFVSECRPELEELRSVSHRSKQAFFFARYRHDSPNLGLLEPTPLVDQVMVALELRALRPTSVFCDGRYVRRPEVAQGALAIHDMRRSWSADIRGPFDTLQAFLPINSFREFAAERRTSFLDFRFDIQHPQLDTVMLHLMQAMLPTLARPNEVSALYLESLFLAVRDHIAETYGGFTTRAASNRLGLTARQLRHALEYIEANLSQDVSLADVADASGTSVSSLIRGFNTALGVSPHRWALNRRIALAQRLIYESATPLNEVAIACGFADQSHLTRVFVRNVGSTPAVWRRNAQR